VGYQLCKSLNNRAARAILRGYQFSLIGSLQSGKPLTVTVGSTVSGPHQANFNAITTSQYGFNATTRVFTPNATFLAANEPDCCQKAAKGSGGRCVEPDQKRLFVIDGSKTLRTAINAVFGTQHLVQRCRAHIAGRDPRLPEGWKVPSRASPCEPGSLGSGMAG
jgi:hypothetical protein